MSLYLEAFDSSATDGPATAAWLVPSGARGETGIGLGVDLNWNRVENIRFLSRAQMKGPLIDDQS